MKKRHVVLVFLVLLSVVTYLDRMSIAVAGPRMQADLAIPPERWGWVLGAFSLSYSLFEIPAGALGDRIGQRKILTRVVVWWSAFTALTGSVSGFLPLLAVRFLFGAGEAGAYPNASGSIARWFPITERGLAQGFVWSASRIGGALTPLTVIPIQAALGWRASFWIFGLLGFGWAAAWYWWYRDHPSRQPGITRTELEEIGSGAPPGRHRIPWGKLFRNTQMWLIMAMYFTYVWGAWFYISWFPTYLVKGRGFSEAEMGLYASLPFFLGAAGNLGGGHLSDRLSRRYGVSIGRRAIGATCLAASALLLAAAAFTPGKLTAVALLALGFGIMDAMLPAAWAVCLDVGEDYAGAVTGAMNSAGQLGGFLCAVAFGYAVKIFGSYDTPLALIASLVMLSAVLFWKIDPARPLAGPGQVPLPGAR